MRGVHDEVRAAMDSSPFASNREEISAAVDQLADMFSELLPAMERIPQMREIHEKITSLIGLLRWLASDALDEIDAVLLPYRIMKGLSE